VFLSLIGYSRIRLLARIKSRVAHTASEEFMRKCWWIVVAFLVVSADAQVARWSEAKANEWYQNQPWLVGSNFIPADAINELEMWQAETFNAPEIDKELGWAQGIGMNTMRVFLHDLLWQQDPDGFKKRIDTFLTISARHRIRPIFVLFDSCWDPHPRLGPQHPPIPGIHNSGWVQSPGADALGDRAQEPRLEAYVKGVVGAFANDSRVLAWDVWNEPSNKNGGAYGKQELKDKQQRVQELLPKVFEWARSVHPSQPLTSGLWEGEWSSPERLDPISRIQYEQSDVLSFHNYSWPEDFEEHVRWLEAYHRPILCTEFMARSAGSTFDTILPVAKRHHVAAINWGLVAGRTQTYLPWDSWQRPYVVYQPMIWFHEVFYPEGRPYRQHEADLIRTLTAPDVPGSQRN
jgi:Cellulase (glycosyl hydrolase family 5)